jgi:O-antigen ligase
MLASLKLFLRLALIPVLYIGTIFTVLVTIFKDAKWGLFLMIALIPQPNMWYKLHSYPYGKDFMDILFFAVLLGIIVQKKGFERTSNAPMIIIFIIISYLALWNCSMRFNLPLPFTTSNELLRDWKNYAEMIFLYFLVLNVVKEEDQQKTLVVIMTVVVLLISIRSYRDFTGGGAFSYDKRYGGPFEAVGLGSNHLGAFIAYTSAVFLGFLFYDKDKKRKWLYLTTVLFSLHPLFFAYSRGAYLAALGVLSFYAVVKKRSLLILVAAILLAWQTILPASVVDRIMMSKTETGEIEGSAAHRLILWDHAMNLFRQNPVFGVGFGGFGFTVPEGETLTDTHNFYVKTLSEQGIIGIVLLAFLLLMAFFSGWRLFRNAKTPFHKGLGFGFMGCVLSVMITNMFGDRWSYFMLGSYFWIFWALVDRGILISKTTKSVQSFENLCNQDL